MNEACHDGTTKENPIAAEDRAAVERGPCAVGLGRVDAADPVPNPMYRTKTFMEFLIESIEVDAMAGFAIVHEATVYSVTGKPYIIRAAKDGCSFLCSELPIKPPYTYDVFDVIVDLLLREGGSARKGMGRNSPLGEGGCTEDTVVGAIGKYYFKATAGKYVFDPVFVLAAVLDWAGIAHNERGYLTLTADYRSLLSR